MSFIAFSAPFQTYLKILFSRSAGRKYENSIRIVREVPPISPLHSSSPSATRDYSEWTSQLDRWRREREYFQFSPGKSFPFQASLRSSLLATLFQLTVARVSFKSLTREEYKGAARRNGKLNPMRRTERWVGWKMLFFQEGKHFFRRNSPPWFATFEPAPFRAGDRFGSTVICFSVEENQGSVFSREIAPQKHQHWKEDSFVHKLVNRSFWRPKESEDKS